MKKLLFFSSFLLTLCFFLNACSNATKQNSKNNEKSEAMMTGKTTSQKDGSIDKIKTETMYVDIKNSKIEWIGEKPTGTHDGTINILKGYIEIDKKGNVKKGEFILDMNSINCTDLQGKKKQSIEEHLKDADFFNTTEHPTASFKINKADSDNIYGILTIKGVSQKIKFPYKAHKDTTALTYVAEIIVNRTLFDIKYKSKTIFPDLGDHFIYDDFKITLNPLVFK